MPSEVRIRGNRGKDPGCPAPPGSGYRRCQSTRMRPQCGTGPFRSQCAVQKVACAFNPCSSDCRQHGTMPGYIMRVRRRHRVAGLSAGPPRDVLQAGVVMYTPRAVRTWLRKTALTPRLVGLVTFSFSLLGLGVASYAATLPSLVEIAEHVESGGRFQAVATGWLSASIGSKGSGGSDGDSSKDAGDDTKQDGDAGKDASTSKSPLGGASFSGIKTLRARSAAMPVTGSRLRVPADPAATLRPAVRPAARTRAARVTVGWRTAEVPATEPAASPTSRLYPKLPRSLL